MEQKISNKQIFNKMWILKGLIQFDKKIHDIEIMGINYDDDVDMDRFRKRIYDIKTFENKIKAKKRKPNGIKKQHEYKEKE